MDADEIPLLSLISEGFCFLLFLMVFEDGVVTPVGYIIGKNL